MWPSPHSLSPQNTSFSTNFGSAPSLQLGSTNVNANERKPSFSAAPEYKFQDKCGQSLIWCSPRKQISAQMCPSPLSLQLRKSKFRHKYGQALILLCSPRIQKSAQMLQGHHLLRPRKANSSANAGHALTHCTSWSRVFNSGLRPVGGFAEGEAHRCPRPNWRPLPGCRTIGAPSDGTPHRRTSILHTRPPSPAIPLPHLT
jgi:hypothetical protein